MAMKIAVALDDDLDGGLAEETVRFGPVARVRDGPEQEERQGVPGKGGAVRRALAAGLAGVAAAVGRAVDSTARERSGDIPAWAKEEGTAMSDRGCIPRLQ